MVREELTIITCNMRMGPGFGRVMCGDLHDRQQGSKKFSMSAEPGLHFQITNIPGGDLQAVGAHFRAASSI